MTSLKVLSNDECLCFSKNTQESCRIFEKKLLHDFVKIILQVFLKFIYLNNSFLRFLRTIFRYFENNCVII